MGVSYVDAVDIVNVVNQDIEASEHVSQFRAGVDFFGAVVLPASEDYCIKLEYAYLLFSYSGTTLYGVSGDFTVVAHLPTLVFQYVLRDEGLYNFKIGTGVGYHFGTFTRNYGAGEERFSGAGPGILLEIEGNSALGDHLFANLVGNLRWDGIGALTNSSGAGPVATAGSPSARLHFFSLGARIGLSYYF